MKAIMVMFDTLNRHFLPPYGLPASEKIKAPNFERLARHTAMFAHSYVGSLPCMPARRELHTGRLNFLHRSWGPIEPYDDSMPQLLSEAGIYTHMISDHQHYWEDGGCTYHHRYNTWEIVRGHEGDRWKAHVKDPKIPEHLGQMWRQDAVNRTYIKTEADQPQTKVFDLGLEYLQTNHDADNWFLHLETFDPHEPFFTMEHYKELYPHAYDGPQFDWPNYAPVTEGQSAVEHMRWQYAALLSMCDRNLGRVLDFMDAHDMWKDTLLIVNTDHGFLLGEHDWWAKTCQPIYEEVAHTPLFIWDPRSGICNEKREALVQTIDIAPTILDFFGQPVPSDSLGAVLRQTVAEDAPVRQACLFGQYGGQINVTDGRYVYMRAPQTQDNKPLYEYTHMPTHMRARFSPGEMRTMQIAGPFSFTKECPVMKIEGQSFGSLPERIMQMVRSMPNGEYAMMKYSETKKTMLFDLEQDPGQVTPINDPVVEERMIRLMVKLMKENDAPSEQYIRMGLEKHLQQL